MLWNGNSLGVLGSYGNVNGNPNSPTNVGSATATLANGSYDVWGYVRLPYRDGNISATALAVHDAIGQQLADYDAPVLLQDVNVQRTTDGGRVVQGQYVP